MNSFLRLLFRVWGRYSSVGRRICTAICLRYNRVGGASLREVPGSNIGPETGIVTRDFFHIFPHSLQTNSHTVL
jgi:hypothetical protein